MTTDRVRRVQQVFDEARGKAPGDRAAFVATTCGADAALRAEVESLLSHGDQAGADFMRIPQPDVGAVICGVSDGPDPFIGERIGGYLIQRVIASGGMGTVYLARQERPARDVAVKVMHAGLASRQARRRFEYESEILARLRHPHIAQIFEAGAAAVSRAGIDSTNRAEASRAVPRPGSGLEDEPARFGPGDAPARFGFEGGPARSVPYFVMEYVPGAETLSKYVEDQRLDMRKRLKLFLQVCDAVHHGHQKGIIHRDLKPANILVDSEAQVKVIDFGVARSTDSDVAVTTMHTEVGQLMGTVAYMSPEQCEADPLGLDMRSDVYSLGVVLYELLCGRLPYDVTRAAIFEATRIIREEPPIRPSTITGKRAGRIEGKRAGRSPAPVPGSRTSRLARETRARRLAQEMSTDRLAGGCTEAVKGDLETILLTALEKDREKRYQSAADLAADIRRHLNREPIAARPPTFWTRTCRWIVRHPKTATATGCLAIVGLIAASTFVADWFLHVHPHSMELVRNRDGAAREARLLTYFGNRVLKTWTTKPPGSIIFAELIDRPEHLGGGRLAVVAFHRAHDQPYPSSLCAFDADDPDTLVWEARIEEGEPLPDPRNRAYTEVEFHPQACWALDVFPESPGMPRADELVVSFSHSVYSQRVLRIYDLTGKPLYQAWQDGGIAGCYWMSEAKLLVLLGGDEDLKENHPDHIELDYPFALAVFAIRPKRGDILHKYILPGGGDGSIVPVWYKVLMPARMNDVLEVGGLHFPSGPHSLGRYVSVDIRFRKVFDAGGSLTLDEDGNEVGRRVLGDVYNKHQKLHPPGDPERLLDWEGGAEQGFYFGDPPSLPSRAVTTAPAGP